MFSIRKKGVRCACVNTGEMWEAFHNMYGYCIIKLYSLNMLQFHLPIIPQSWGKKSQNQPHNIGAIISSHFTETLWNLSKATRLASRTRRILSYLTATALYGFSCLGSNTSSLTHQLPDLGESCLKYESQLPHLQNLE